MQHAKPRYLLTEGFALLGLSRSKGYLRIKQGLLKPVYDGGTPYLTAAEVDRYAVEPQPRIEYARSPDASGKNSGSVTADQRATTR